MPSFKIKGKSFNNPVELCLHEIGGKWKIPILWRLRDKTMRYGELKKSIPKCTHQVLAAQLKELEKDGYLSRKVYAAVPPKVEYSLTEKGKQVMPVIDSMRNWGIELMRGFRIDVDEYLRSR
jgi:DNA-binding HxlR family transcriptional regulator